MIDWCDSWRKNFQQGEDPSPPIFASPRGLTHFHQCTLSQPSPILQSPQLNFFYQCLAACCPSKWVTVSHLSLQGPGSPSVLTLSTSIGSRIVVNLLSVQLLLIVRLTMKLFPGLCILLHLQLENEMPLCIFILFPRPRMTSVLISKYQNPSQILHIHQKCSLVLPFISQLPFLRAPEHCICTSLFFLHLVCAIW